MKGKSVLFDLCSKEAGMKLGFFLFYILGTCVVLEAAEQTQIPVFAKLSPFRKPYVPCTLSVISVVCNSKYLSGSELTTMYFVISCGYRGSCVFIRRGEVEFYDNCNTDFSTK